MTAKKSPIFQVGLILKSWEHNIVAHDSRPALQVVFVSTWNSNSSRET